MEFLENRFQRHSLLNSHTPKPAWVNERPGGHQRVQSEPRQRNDRLQSLAPAGGRSGGVVLAENARRLAYRSENYGSPHQQERIARRQKSLPPRKPSVGSHSLDVRKTNSASDKEKIQNYRNAKQTVSLYLASPGAREHELGPETRQVIHGIRTRCHEENYLRSTKFASSWAKVRAENLALRDGSPGEMSPPRTSRDGSNNSPRRDGSPSKSTECSTGPGGLMQHHRFVLTKPRGRPPNRAHQKAKHKRAQKTDTSPEANITQSPRRGSSAHSGRSRETSEWSRDAESQETRSFGSGKGPSIGEEEEEGEEGEEENTKKRRPAWNNSVKMVSAAEPRVNLRKYEKSLTFKPTITTKEEVYMAYTGHDSLLAAQAALESDLEERLSISSDGETSGSSRSNSGSPGRSKERMLNKREARAYLKMTAVYGSDAFKNQRKQWFLQKLALAQDQKAKLDEERRRAEEKKREEDRKKQQRQLNYVREKFRKEQVHRFRTQYVTSRVLEHEHANRHEYGLPEEFDDGTTNNENTKNALPASENNDNVENSLEEQTRPYPSNGYISGNKHQHSNYGQNVNDSQHRKFNKNHNLDGAAPTTTKKQTDADRRNQARKEKEEERQKQRQEQQKSWYAAYERIPRTEARKPPLDTGDSRTRNQGPIKSNGKTPATLKSNTAKPSPAAERDYKNGTGDNVINKDENKRSNSNDNRTTEAANLRRLSQETHQNHLNRSSDKEYKAGSNDAPKNGRSLQGGSNQSGSDNNEQDGRGHSQAAHDNKKIYPDIKDTGPTLPHTKSHADPQHAKDRKASAPYIFAGHFRQEADGTYHTLEESNLAGTTGSETNRENAPAATEKRHSIDPQSNGKRRSSQLLPSVTVADSENSKETKTAKPTPKQTDSDLRRKSKDLSGDDASVSHYGPRHRNNSTAIKSAQNSKDKNSGANVQDKNKKQIPSHPPTSKAPNDEMKPPSSSTAPLHDTENITQKPSNTVQTSGPERPASRAVGARSYKNVAPSALSKPTSRVASKPSQQQQLQHQSPETQQQRQPQNPRGARGRGRVQGERQETASSRRSSNAERKKLRGAAVLANLMFDVNMGPAWDPHQKVPKMEGIDTVVIKTKDGKGQVVKQKKQVKNVVKDAEKLLSVPSDATKPEQRPKSKRSFRMASPDVTLGSDFDVDDDDEEETVGDIFERLRKKYNIKIDSDEEDEPY